MNKKIKSALISVFYKDNLEPIVKKLGELGVTIFSTGGTQEFIEKLGAKVTPVETLTSYPSILGGRVKTLHPKIFGGILSRREKNEDASQLLEYKIPEIDLVIVDLYPFEETVAKTKDETEIIEKIDIGGISLIRAGAKNFNDVVIVPSKNEYAYLLKILEEKKGTSSLEDRKYLATKAFAVTSKYDTAIYSYFSGELKVTMPNLNGSASKIKSLRYGENPHQKGTFYGDFEKMFSQLNGKELSYNNLLDIDSAVNLIAEFSETTFAILKHNNACGIASRKKLIDAWKDALAGDSVSAFGGILIANTKVDEATAQEINKLFFEVIIAPAYDETALNILKQKQNRIILLQKEFVVPSKLIRTTLNGYLEQDRDFKSETEAEMKTVTKISPTKEELSDLVFANKIVKHTKSNTIVLAKNKQLLASGVGQTSRVDALKQAIIKAKSFGFDLKGAVMASDAFFPFPDCVEIAYNAGVKAVVQPGGSIKDKDSIEFCNKNGMAMVMTGTRHFKH
ncbi:MAG: bifunctional phosphoribosylaminoimidazolecarboxamide formyltransferase/IMP cyclohydrolase [Bacteroidetes bacterium]|nr:bifunctional phosphoribosylaminoimidazolecarboxamide formyltransferase/IMP cyclohydrolase [Bacteroidota bacterium]